MKFEVDLIRYIVDLSIARRVFIRSKDLNADWLPFTTILQVFLEICHKLGVAKEVESRCYKALLKMCSSHERHVTWEYKMKNIKTYLPTQASTHAAKHTSSSWTKHRIPHNLSTSISQSSRKSHRGDDYVHNEALGLNLGRLSQRGFFADYSSYHTTAKRDPRDDYALRNMLNEISIEDRIYPPSDNHRNRNDMSGSYNNRSDNILPTPPTAPQQAVTSPPVILTPGKDQQIVPPLSAEPPSTPYYRDYIPTARWEAQGLHPVTPITPILSSEIRSDSRSKIPSSRDSNHSNSNTPFRYHTSSAATEAAAMESIASGVYTPSSKKLNTNEGPFADEELIAMQQRVETIEAEARRTRQLLAQIAFLKESSTGARLDMEDSSEAALEAAERTASFERQLQQAQQQQQEQQQELDYRHRIGQNLSQQHGQHSFKVEFGEIPLSPYLKEVLHLPKALITTDIYQPSLTQSKGNYSNNRNELDMHRDHINSSKVNSSNRGKDPVSPINEQSEATSQLNQKGGDSTKRRPPAFFGSPFSSHQDVMASMHMHPPLGTVLESPAETVYSYHSSSTPTPRGGSGGSASGGNSNRYSKSPKSSSHSLSHSDPTAAMDKVKSNGKGAEKNEGNDNFSSSLRYSSAMRKYLEMTSHRNGGEVEQTRAVHSNLSSPSSRSHQRSPSPSSRSSLHTPPSSMRSQQQRGSRSPSSGHSHNVSWRSGESLSPSERLSQLRKPSTSDILSAGADMDHEMNRVLSHAQLQSLSPSQALRYHNSLKTMHANNSDLTTIDSKIDDLLGDSLNIEEKDGRVYVHFQSKFLL